MNSKERRKYIYDILIKKTEPQKGSILASDLGVTRQIIVKDIALLRAEGINIIATPEGYLIPKNEKQGVKKIIAVCHKPEDIEDELSTIIKFGGIIEDVIIEHQLYGEIRGMLMIKTMYDLQNFINKSNEMEVEPLSTLTRGVHLHTIEAENNENMNKIIEELKNKKYLLYE